VSGKLAQILKKIEQQNIERHMPAKDAVIAEPDSDVERFAREFDQAWIDTRDTSRSVETDGFHPSSLGISAGKCGRRNVYLLRGERKEFVFDPRVMRVFANGHAVHERLQAMLHKMKYPFDDEVKIAWENPPVRGHCDGVLEYNGRRIIIEIKSCSPEVYMNRLKWKKPKDDHFAQANIYAHILDCDTIWIIYENKGSQEIKIFEKPADRKESQKILDKWHAEWLCFQDGELPVRPYKPDSPVCAGCDMKETCFSDSNVGVSLKPYKDRVKEINEGQAEEG
jgi:CRISPR/Cas system-associated exonuclease Cas4 (RecB family)